MKGTLSMIALVIVVTVGGLMAGALFVSPVVSSMPWVLPSVGGVAATAVIGALVVYLKPVRSEQAAGRAARSESTIAMPSLSFGGKSDRTPRAVQALADAGKAPTEIAWRTGLPVDAVALLLAISTASRQLQPPTA